MSNKIIIVGNGSSVLDKENGELINSFENVVRFNKYIIDGFEKNVGTKTNIWFTVLPISFYKKNWRLKVKYDEVYFCYRFNQDIKWYEQYVDYYKNTKTSVKKIKESDVYKDIKQSEIYKNILKGVRIAPSTGLAAILNLINIYGKVYITGFDWWEREKNHYYDNSVRAAVHNPQIEKQIIYNLKDQNKIEFI